MCAAVSTTAILDPGNIVLFSTKLSFAGEGEDPLGEAAGDEGGGRGGVEVKADHPH